MVSNAIKLHCILNCISMIEFKDFVKLIPTGIFQRDAELSF